MKFARSRRSRRGGALHYTTPESFYRKYSVALLRSSTGMTSKQGAIDAHRCRRRFQPRPAAFRYACRKRLCADALLRACGQQYRDASHDGGCDRASIALAFGYSLISDVSCRESFMLDGAFVIELRFCGQSPIAGYSRGRWTWAPHMRSCWKTDTGSGRKPTIRND